MSSEGIYFKEDSYENTNIYLSDSSENENSSSDDSLFENYLFEEGNEKEEEYIFQPF